MDFQNWKAQVRRGLLDMIVMELLEHGERHGYEMVQKLKQLKGLTVREGNIYPILVRLQTDGLVGIRTRTSADGPPRKHYRLTKAGRRTLKRMNEHWDELIGSLREVKGKAGRTERPVSGRKRHQP